MGSCFSKERIVSKPGIRFIDIKDQIKPLDLITFRGAEFVSDAIALVEKIRLGVGNWTHVGIVITTDVIPIENGIKGRLYVWESTMSGCLGDGVNNTESKKWHFGVQIRDLEEVIDKYDNNSKTKIGWCKVLHNPLDDQEKAQQTKEILTKIHTDLSGAMYDYNFCNLFSSMICTCTEQRRAIFGRSNKYFCSELAAMIYKSVGIITENIDPVKIAPEELLDAPKNDDIKEHIVKCPPVLITRDWTNGKTLTVDINKVINDGL